MKDKIILYSYFRSSASYRVRIALNYKNIPYEYRAVHLIKGGGEQYSTEYQKLNPQSQVPCLVHHNQPIAQSMAILEYLDAIYPEPNLFPRKPVERALVTQICEIINSGMQPYQNTSVTSELEKTYGFTAEKNKSWILHWMNKGFTALEEVLKTTAGEHCFGSQITAADCFLVPQVFSAERFGVDLKNYPKVKQLNETALRLEAFQLAEPKRQPDYTA